MFPKKHSRLSAYFIFLVFLSFAALISKTAIAQVQSDITVMSFDAGHGTQVGYRGPDGRYFLWYPGNQIVLPALWKSESGQICFVYGPQTYNPVTKEEGGDWKCISLEILNRYVLETAEGDIFGLSQRITVPFVLPKQRTTLAKLAGRAVDSTQVNETTVIDEAIRLDLQTLMTLCPPAGELELGNSLSYIVAGGIHFWGGLRTEETNYQPNGCAPVNYEMAFAMFWLAGDRHIYLEMVKLLKEQAQNGATDATRALRTLDLSPP